MHKMKTFLLWVSDVWHGPVEGDFVAEFHVEAELLHALLIFGVRPDIHLHRTAELAGAVTLGWWDPRLVVPQLHLVEHRLTNRRRPGPGPLVSVNDAVPL